MWNKSKIDFLLFFNKITFQCNISVRNELFPDYEIPIKLQKITDNRIKKLIISKQKHQTSKKLKFSEKRRSSWKNKKYRLWSYSSSNQFELKKITSKYL
jgi:hypothetical protein